MRIGTVSETMVNRRPVRTPSDRKVRISSTNSLWMTHTLLGGLTHYDVLVRGRELKTKGTTLTSWTSLGTTTPSFSEKG